MSKNKYLIDKKVILDCERMTLSRDRESLKISESECNLLLAFHQGLFKKDDLIAWVWGRKGVVVSSASYYKLINQLRGSFEKIGLSSSAVLTRPKVGVTLSVTIEPLPDESTPATQNRASDTVAPVAESLPEPTQSSQAVSNRKEWLFLICATLFLLMVIYLYSKRHPDYFSELGTYNGYTFYGVIEDNRSLEDAVGAFSELSQQVYKQNGNFIYYIRVPDTNIFVQCLNQLNVSEPKCITIKERY
ncbi:transcriptional regulator [Klebsiella oxytoca]|uniref:winged helix-turn-helix domain-containing protein n=1 Tax=Klebsiella oxytoca TaxID=571 RepID=UPI001B33633D|nr:response regulator [Klebsiella oxytoca]QTV84370.1 response regulator [Klebsiella oxytoca]